MSALQLAQRAQKASISLKSCTEEQRVSALKAMAKHLEDHGQKIKEANAKDVEEAKTSGLPSALVDRLLLNDQRIRDMVAGVLEVAAQPVVVGEIVSQSTRNDGLVIKKERIPLGVIAMVFESRPNVVVDTSSLAIKSGNAILLKGGKEAKHSNKVLAQVIQESLLDILPEHSVELLETREDISELLGLNKYVDVIIPRGGEKLIRHVYDNAKMPVIAHFAGLCHGYIHKDADLKQALKICLNAKAQRPGVCNAMETLLVHKGLPKEFLNELFNRFCDEGIELRLDDGLHEQFPNHKQANVEDWSTEYLDKILSIKQVSDLNEAIEHIQQYGTHHTEFICSQDPATQTDFQNNIDASCIMINASSRFNDGGQLGLGAELGISTSKIHAYGPMGAREMTTTRYLVVGQGHVRK